MKLSGMIYPCAAGETFDSVALEVYGDEKYAAELLCANPKLSHKLIFCGGEELQLPEIYIPVEEEDTGSSPPWKE